MMCARFCRAFYRRGSSTTHTKQPMVNYCAISKWWLLGPGELWRDVWSGSTEGTNCAFPACESLGWSSKRRLGKVQLWNNRRNHEFLIAVSLPWTSAWRNTWERRSRFARDRRNFDCQDKECGGRWKLLECSIHKDKKHCKSWPHMATQTGSTASSKELCH